MMDRHEDGKPGSRKRLHALDELRGAAVLSMVAFHAAYDLVYLYGVDMPLFTTGWIQELWRVSISWTFLALAGWMTSLSRSNLRRGCQYAAVAVAIWIATSWAAVDTPISFGIIYCMAACTLLWWCLEHAFPQALTRWRGPAAFLCVVLFGVLYQVPRSRYAVGASPGWAFPAPASHRVTTTRSSPSFSSMRRARSRHADGLNPIEHIRVGCMDGTCRRSRG